MVGCAVEHSCLAASWIMWIVDSKLTIAELYRAEGKGSETRWIRVEGSTTDIADPMEKIACTLEVLVPLELGCSGRGW